MASMHQLAARVLGNGCSGERLGTSFLIYCGCGIINFKFGQVGFRGAKNKNQTATPMTTKPATVMAAIFGRLDFLADSVLSGFASTAGFSVGLIVGLPAAATGVVAVTAVTP